MTFSWLRSAQDSLFCLFHYFREGNKLNSNTCVKVGVCQNIVSVLLCLSIYIIPPIMCGQI